MSRLIRDIAGKIERGEKSCDTLAAELVEKIVLIIEMPTCAGLDMMPVEEHSRLESGDEEEA